MEENIGASSSKQDISITPLEINKSLENITQFTVLEENMELLELDDEIIDKQEKKEINASYPRVNPTNRRYSLRPKKRPENKTCDGFAMNSSKRRSLSLPKNGLLETIFEHPVDKDGSLAFLGKKRFKRYITFNDFVTQAKSRQRKLKIKRMSKIKFKKTRKVTLEDVRKKLKYLEEANDEDNEWMDITT